MATQNLDSADLKGVAVNGLINEDVMQKIIDISKVPLNLTDMIPEESSRNSYKEWTQDELSTPNIANARIDGEDTINSNDTKTGARVGNHHQISTKTLKVSTRARASDTIGRDDELSYQVIRRTQEARRDVEAIMLTSQQSRADDGSSNAGLSGGLGAWLTTNTNRGAGGANGGFANSVVAAPTAGTARPISETDLRDVAELVYSQGGNPTVTQIPSVEMMS